MAMSHQEYMRRATVDDENGMSILRSPEQYGLGGQLVSCGPWGEEGACQWELDGVTMPAAEARAMLARWKHSRAVVTAGSCIEWLRSELMGDRTREQSELVLGEAKTWGLASTLRPEQIDSGLVCLWLKKAMWSRGGR